VSFLTVALPRRCNDQMRALRAEMLHASAAMRAQLQAEIAELEAQLVPLRAELERLRTLLDRCYLRQSVMPDRGAILVNA
jgi:ABC-type phosphate transport system auxiliary subunit